MTEKRKKGVPEFSLYLITGGGGIDAGFFDRVKSALDGGVRAIQLREKDLSGRDLLAAAQRLRLLTHEYGALLFINDRTDVAMLSGADGVHLGQNSIPPLRARGLLGGEHIIGVSAHSLAEAVKAGEDGADFITFGPVYDTASKAQWGPPVGLAALKETVKSVNVPVFALGGIKKDLIGEVIRAGAYGVAAISAILSSTDVRTSAAELIREIERYRSAGQ